MVKLAITGGIGSGKSIVSHLLQVMGIPVYLTDDEAKRLTIEDAVIRNELSLLVGKEVYKSDGTLDRAWLSSYMFGSPERVRQVNSIIHPRVKDDFLRWVARHNTPLIAMECAILYESGFDSLVDKVVVVSAPLELRVNRAIRRDNAQEWQIRQRMAHQLDDVDLCRKADYVVCNDGVLPLIPQVTGILHELDIL